MPPQEALGVFTETLDRRFRDFDADYQTKLKDAMKWEDKTLLQYIERNRLPKWLRETLEAAQLKVQDERDIAIEADATAANIPVGGMDEILFQ